MITFKQDNSDYFTNNADIIINTVNCVGVMGKGIALAFKNKYPDNFILYKRACKNNNIKIGEMFITNFDKTIVNFPTKIHWKNNSEYEYIYKGLINLRSYLEYISKIFPDKIVNIPALGCSNGGLEWDKVKEIIINTLNDINLNINVYENEHKILK